jgi:hypothetical protein
MKGSIIFAVKIAETKIVPAKAKIIGLNDGQNSGHF